MNRRIKLITILLIMGVSISLNFLTFYIAYPETQKIDAGCCAPKGTVLARDFSAFYFGAWNLLHSPSQIYVKGSSANASFLGIEPHPETFKYLPSFLIFILPFLSLSYLRALHAFDAIQFALLFLIAFLIYRLLQRKNIAILGAISILTLSLPFSTMSAWGISEAYFWQWAEGQDKAFDLALILLAFYFAMSHKPALSGIFFGLSFFDPRFSLVAIPLFLTLNQGKIRLAVLVTSLSFIVSNLPILVLPGIFPGFLGMLVSVGVTTPIYYYSYIPLISIVALSLANWREIALTFSKVLKRKEADNPKAGIVSRA